MVLAGERVVVAVESLAVDNPDRSPGTVIGCRHLESTAPWRTAEIAFDERGLVPCIVQDWRTGEVLTLAYMNAESLRADTRDRRDALLQPLAPGAVAQGRDVGQHPGGEGDPLRLRRRRAAGAGRAGRPGLPHRRADLLSPRRARAAGAARGAADARADDRRRAQPPAPRAPTRRRCSPTRRGSARRSQEEAEEVARAAREESDERVAEEAADVLYHLAVLLRSRGLSLADAERVLDAPSPLSCGRRRRAPSLEEVRELARDHNLIPLSRDVHRRLPDAGVGVPEAARATGPSFLLESADQGRVGRYSFIGFRPRKVLRWSLGDPGDPYALAAEELARFRAAPLPDLPPFAGGAVGMFAYDLVRTVEPLGEPEPRSARRARPGADAHRRAGRVRPPQAHGHGARERVRRRRSRGVLRAGGRRRSPRCAGGWRARCRRPSRPPAADRRRPGVHAEHVARAVRGAWSPGSSSTSTPATPTRSCPRSAGRRRCRSRRSRSTAGCARSTRARTCTSSTSATSRSPAPARSR